MLLFNLFQRFQSIKLNLSEQLNYFQFVVFSFYLYIGIFVTFKIVIPVTYYILVSLKLKK